MLGPTGCSPPGDSKPGLKAPPEGAAVLQDPSGLNPNLLAPGLLLTALHVLELLLDPLRAQSMMKDRAYWIVPNSRVAA